MGNLIEQSHAGFNIHQFTGIEKVHLDDYGNYKTVKKGPEGLYLPSSLFEKLEDL